MNKQTWIRAAVLVVAGALCWWAGRPGWYALAGALWSTAVTTTIGYYIVSQQQKRFNKWVRDAVETDVSADVE